MEIMNKECTPERKHHKLPLSSRGPDKDFPNKRKMEEFRLNNVKKRFKHNKKFHEDYPEFMQDVICKSHARLQN